eukprot:2744408-Pleurochrysis_carterae.AAC.1
MRARVGVWVQRWEDATEYVARRGVSGLFETLNLAEARTSLAWMLKQVMDAQIQTTQSLMMLDEKSSIYTVTT